MFQNSLFAERKNTVWKFHATSYWSYRTQPLFLGQNKGVQTTAED